MLVSSLCITSPCAACRINSSSAGLITSRGFFDDLPLRRCRQRNPQLIFQPFQPVERHPAAVLQLRDHRRGRLVVLLRTHCLPVPRAVNTCPQALQRSRSISIHGRFQRRLPHDPHQRLRLFLAVHFSLAAFRAAVAVHRVLVRDVDLLRAAKRSGAVAPMSGRRRFAGIRLCPRRLRISGFSSTALVFSVFRGRTSLAAMRMQGVFELLAIGFAQRRLPCSDR